MHFEIYQEQTSLSLLASGNPNCDYRWRLIGDNGRIIADSGEGYRNKSDCQHGIDLVKGSSNTTPVVERATSIGLLDLFNQYSSGIKP